MRHGEERVETGRGEGGGRVRHGEERGETQREEG